MRRRAVVSEKRQALKLPDGSLCSAAHDDCSRLSTTVIKNVIIIRLPGSGWSYVLPVIFFSFATKSPNSLGRSP